MSSTYQVQFALFVGALKHSTFLADLQERKQMIIRGYKTMKPTTPSKSYHE